MSSITSPNLKIYKGKHGGVDQEHKSGNIISEFDSNQLVFYVNGQRVEDSRVDPRTTLAVYLRDHLQLKGTKIGCNEGGCGACTVMISDVEPLTEQLRHYSANACLTPICAVFGKAVTTVEGIGGPLSLSKRLHPVQERLSKAHGSQCGYCTPGFVMAMYSLLRNSARPSQAEIDDSIQGNLCRCTGYRPILEAFYSFIPPAKERLPNGFCAQGEACCRKAAANGCDESNPKIKLTNFENCTPYDLTQELIFPPELKLHKWHALSFGLESVNGILWLQPTTLQHLLALKKLYPHGRLISGNSELAIELKFRFIDISVAINPKQVPELREVRMHEEHGLYIGMALSLTEMREVLNKYIEQLPEWKTAVFRSVCSMLHYFAGKHVRNMASAAGNIATASPISDLNPIWMAAGARVVLESEERGERTLLIDNHFFVGYRRTVVQSDEVIKAIWIPFSKHAQFFRAYKQAQRREDDIAIVTAAFSVTFNHLGEDTETLDSNSTIKEIRIAFGGMAPTTKLALESVKGFENCTWSNKLLEEMIQRISAEFQLPAGVPGGMSRFRQTLTISFFFKFFVHVAEHLGLAYYSGELVQSKVGEPQPLAFSSTQIYQEVPKEQPAQDPVGRPRMHESGVKHTTGEAVYCTDTKIFGCLHLAYVLSPVASGTIDTVDVSAALQLPGVIGFIDNSDVPGNLMIGHGDVPVFPKYEPIGAVIAEDHELARRAANLVKVDVSPNQNPVITIEDAIKSDSFHFQKPFKLHSSYANGGKTLNTCENWQKKYTKIVEGQIRIGGQEHFYLETQNAVAIPGESGEMEIISSTQATNDVQGDVSKALGVPRHKVKVTVRRIGGGFGGKEFICGLFASAAAVAAFKFKRPVRITLERYDDMAISGTRHPFLFKYRMAVDEDGKFLDYDIQAYSNCGMTVDLSKGVMGALLSVTVITAEDVGVFRDQENFKIIDVEEIDDLDYADYLT